MTWEAANTPKEQTAGSGNHDQDHRQHKARATETVEAALARLSKAYTTSISCIGNLGKTCRMLQKEPASAITDDKIEVLHRVSRAARTTLENAVFQDPLVVPHIPALHQTMAEFGESQDSNYWEFVKLNRPPPPLVSSTAHKSTIKELTYLALVNYSDLLQSCSVWEGAERNDDTILDRGVVKRFKVLSDSQTCCWNETEESTQRLAITALCDASDLDGSDPTLWLKLACSARALERILCTKGDSAVSVSRYRRLQRYALERGLQALPPHMPPNRTVCKALEELNLDPGLDGFKPIGGSVSKTTQLVLELPRYSWSVLGRFLARACREGANFHSEPKHGDAPRNERPLAAQFGSPTIVLQLSAMLMLPSKVLGRICKFLDNGSIWRFEATCRALSVALISARASMEEEKCTENSSDGKEETSSRTGKGDKGPAKGNVHDNETGLEKGERMEQKSEGNSSCKNMKYRKNSSGSGSEIVTQASSQSSRASKRLRSQLITSGKIAERSSNRQSFDYCFLAATLASTRKMHRNLIDQLRGTAEYQSLHKDDETSSSAKSWRISRNESNDNGSEIQQEAQERIGDASLSSFVERWSNRNSGPMDLLIRYLTHVAVHVQDVFDSDPGGTVVLTSCILACFELCNRRTGCYQGISPSFFKPVLTAGSFQRSLELFAVDLLHAELLLKQCDRYSPNHVEFDDDCNIVSIMMPELLSACDELNTWLETGTRRDESSGLVTQYLRLRIRCYWLAAGFYLWRSRISRFVWESREAEDEGTFFIEEARKSFDVPKVAGIKVVPTPHLVSPGRVESHWKEISPASLAKLRDDIQASSVVSLARQRYQDFLSTMDESNVRRLHPSQEVDFKTLADIGELLFDRYKSPFGAPDAKHSELIEDFLTVHGDELQELTHEGSKGLSSKTSTVGRLIPTTRLSLKELLEVSNPSILTMLISCLKMNAKRSLGVLELLARLVLTSVDVHGRLTHRISEVNNIRRTDDEQQSETPSDSEESSYMSGEASVDRNASNKNADVKRARQCGFMVEMLIGRMCQEFTDSTLTDEERLAFLQSTECSTLIDSVLQLSSSWYHKTTKRVSTVEDDIDQRLFQSVRRLMRKLGNAATEPTKDDLEALFFRCMVRTVILHRNILGLLLRPHGGRTGRSLKQKICLKRAEYVGLVTTEIGDMLSKSLGAVRHCTKMRSKFLTPRGNHGAGDFALSETELAMFLDSMLSLWKLASKSDAENPAAAISGNQCTSFDRPIVKELRVPVAIGVVGVCGAASFSRSGVENLQKEKDSPGSGNMLCLGDFYDSDASANDLTTDNESDMVEYTPEMWELLRVVCHAVHCVSHVVGCVDDKDALSLDGELGDGGGQAGPVLPLVLTRVLNYFADTILQSFEADDKESPDLWSDEYPYRTRTFGQLLDSLLYKAYRWLYGFVLVGEKSHQAIGKDLASSVTTAGDLTVRKLLPESTTAAAQLYRCIVRAYSGGRRSPPKAALEVISAALPPMKESERSKALRTFLFAPDPSRFDLSSVQRLVMVGDGWEKMFEEVQARVYDVGGVDGKDGASEAKRSTQEDEITKVRRGISSELAKGPLPVGTVDLGKNKADAGLDDERLIAMRNEEEISKKFFAILDDICLGDMKDCEGLYRAGQCLAMKGELIADRLGLSLGFARPKDFSVPAPRGQRIPSMQLQGLEREQERDEIIASRDWVKYLGSDLSLYVRYIWSSIPSLKDCAAAVKHELDESVPPNEGGKSVEQTTLARIRILYQAEDYVRWQEAWGGIFVNTLRHLSVRFMCLAVYLLQSKSDPLSEDIVLLSEIYETLGIAIYSDLMASQNYGFPMHPMVPKRKRDLARAARMCFQAATDLAERAAYQDDESEDRATWDLLFMIGKCEEKIAGTYRRQSFARESAGGGDAAGGFVREYEKHMSLALESYSVAYWQAKSIEDEGGFIVDQSGGSAHGSTEVLYRLLASRLKCLIEAVSRESSELAQAEAEALRITEKYWFQQAGKSSGLDRRDRVWNVLADVVTGLAQCRLNHAYFHRSVYRHAQALMWAPVLYAPSNAADGSLGTVPATRSYQVRGLNNSTHAANSAEVIMSSLFDKRRSQLCAVWVTTTSSCSPFQILNNSTRKYDSLRGKYISAYLECLRLCRRRSELETFLKWTSTTRRDLPSFFQASARNGGAAPAKPHTHDCLLHTDQTLSQQCFLISVKRQTNSAFADVLLGEIKRIGSCSDENKKSMENLLKYAYACFLRVHCTMDDLRKSKAWRYGQNVVLEVEAVCQAYLSLGDTMTSPSNMNGWSGSARKAAIFGAALEKCRLLFPSLSGSFFLRKTPAKGKKGGESDANDGMASRLKKRKSNGEGAPASNVSFDVLVPKSLSHGDTFFTVVKIGETNQKVKLTVPKGNPSTLRFTLKVPTRDASKHKKPRTEGC